MTLLFAGLLAFFFGGSAGSIVAFAAKKLVPRFWDWLVVVIMAGLVGYVTMIASANYAQDYILGDPDRTGEGGLMAMATVFGFAFDVSLFALMGYALGAVLVFQQKPKA